PLRMRRRPVTAALSCEPRIGGALAACRATCRVIDQRLDRMRAATAFCGAAQRCVDTPHAWAPRRAREGPSHIGVTEDIARTDDHGSHRELKWLSGVRAAFLGGIPPAAPAPETLSGARQICLNAWCGA